MKQVYADFNATYPCSDGHLETVTRVLRKCQGNPSSIHSFGRDAKLILEQSRTQVAALFGAPRQNIFFTSGATEANNLALHSSVATSRSMSIHAQPKIVITEGAHPSIYAPVKILAEQEKANYHSAKLTPGGPVDEQHLLSLVTNETTLVALCLVNSETGAINQIEALSKAIKEKSPECHIHIDAVQGLGKINLSWLHTSNIDSASGSAHKLGGLKGIGCLYHKNPRSISPMVYGGGQEMSIRSGTENMPGLISFGLRAKEILHSPEWWKTATVVCKNLAEHIGGIAKLHIHGNFEQSTQTTLNFHIEGVAVENIMLHLDSHGIAVSRGSACSSGSSTASKTLLSMGYPEEVAANSIRVSFGSTSTPEDAEWIGDKIVDFCSSL